MTERDDHMYYCPNCKSEFDEPKLIKDYVVNDPYPDGPIICVCPFCRSEDFVQAVKCDGCGEYIIGEYVKVSDRNYCEDCYEMCDTTDF